MLVLVVGLLVTTVATPALGQEDQPDDAVVDGEPAADGSGDGEPAAEDDPVAEDDAAPEEVPISEDTVPPDPEEPVDGAEAERLIRRELSVARAHVVRSIEDVQEAKGRVVALSERLMILELGLARLDVAHQAAAKRLEAAQARFEERVANAVVRGNAAELDTVFASQDVNEADLRRQFLRTVSAADVGAVEEFEAAKAVLDAGMVEALGEVGGVRAELREARADLRDKIRVNAQSRFQLAVFAAGSEIVIRGFVFPVDEPYTFGDSWGFPRMVGTEYEHGHQGVDIMAPFGTPLYATERGIIIRVGVDVLGGTKLWLKGESGTYYYYAHLSSYEDGVGEGTLVEAGDLVGYVGDTGNARGGAPHLHFQLHPGGGEPVNPYPLLRVVADLSRR